MPVRRAVTRTPSVDVQGEDSWIEFVPPTWGEAKKILAMRDGASDSDNMELGEQVLRDSMRTWNWVDYDGTPLPPPTEDGIFDRLTVQEVKFIAEAITSGFDAKN